NHALARAFVLGVQRTDPRVENVQALIGEHAANIAAAEQAAKVAREALILRLQRLVESSDSVENPSTIPIDYLANCTLQWDPSPERSIGNGVFGNVFLAVDPERNFRFVVKKVNLGQLAALYDELLNRMRVEVARSEEAEQLRIAQLAAEERLQLAQLKCCCICYDDECKQSDGTECRNEDEKHFLCNSCMNREVGDQDKKDKNNIIARDNKIRCPAGAPGLHGTIIPCTAYHDFEISKALAEYPQTYEAHVLNYAKIERWRLEDVGNLEIDEGEVGGGGAHWRREQELLNAEADRKRQFDLMEQSYNDLVLANAIREEDEAAQRAAEEKIRETQERLRREREATENVISVTTKRCPNCGEEQGTGLTLDVGVCFAMNANQADHANRVRSMEAVQFVKVWLSQTICEII
ncbi:hypothetical protein ScalyP_jg5735, partial [Parmales sp. scaly parma]